MGDVSGLAAPAACASEGAAEYYRSQPYLRQACSQLGKLAPPQDHFRMQAPRLSRETDAKVKIRLPPQNAKTQTQLDQFQTGAGEEHFL